MQLTILTRITPALLVAALAFSTASCSEEKGDTVKREVSEEAADIVNAVGPESAAPPEPTAPPALTTPEATTSAISQAGGLTALPLAAANESIDLWIGSLRGNGVVDDSDILVENLTKLKGLLAASPINGEEVGNVLEILARETKQAADDADNAAVKALAEALEEGAGSLD